MLKTFSNKYSLELSRQENSQKLFSVKAGGRTMLLYFVLAAVAGFLLSFLIISVTPLKRLVPGYPTEKTRKKAVQNQIMLDSLKLEIQQWQKQLHDIQLITSGRMPSQEAADTTTLGKTAWEEYEKHLNK